MFVSVLPRVAPRFNKAGEVRGFDDVVGAKERTKINTVLQFQYGGKVEAIDLFFDIDNVKVLTEFNTVSISNLDPLVLV